VLRRTFFFSVFAAATFFRPAVLRRTFFFSVFAATTFFFAFAVVFLLALTLAFTLDLDADWTTAFPLAFDFLLPVFAIVLPSWMPVFFTLFRNNASCRIRV